MWKRLLGVSRPDDRWFSSLAPKGLSIEMTYLGTAGFVLKSKDRCLVLDPYVTRPGLKDTLTKRLHPDPDLIRDLIPHADDVLIGHAHYDHILDAPELCCQTGARLIGSPAAVMVGRAAGLPASQMRATMGREDIACGPWVVRGLPSRHGKAVLGRVPFPGDITEPPPWPPRLNELRHGLVLNWWVNAGGLRIVHIDSADFIRRELMGVKADVVCLCAIGRKYRPDYIREVVELLQPRWIVPCHWDTMITPIDAPPEVLPGVDLPGMLEEIRNLGVEPLLTHLLGKQYFPVE